MPQLSPVVCLKVLMCVAYPGVTRNIGLPCCLSNTSRNTPHFMEPEGALPHSQERTTSPYPEADRSSPCSHLTSRRSILTLSSSNPWLTRFDIPWIVLQTKKIHLFTSHRRLENRAWYEMEQFSRNNDENRHWTSGNRLPAEEERLSSSPSPDAPA